MFILFFFFFKQKTAYEMRISDWSSDVCSSDLDEKSLVVTYKHWRGEKRGSLKKAEANPGAFGDCIDCNQFVAVCLTGVDIREGPQIGCITCALCIDACDPEIGRAHVCTQVTNAHLECRLLLDKKTHSK